MASIDIEIAGRHYDMVCRDGDEPKFRALAKIVDGKANDAARAMGGLGEARQLLFAALLLADELADARAAAATAAALPEPVPDAALASALERLAKRMEILAARLETDTAIA